MENIGVMRRQSQRIREQMERKKQSQGSEGPLESPPTPIPGLPLPAPSISAKQPKERAQKTPIRKGKVGNKTLRQTTKPVNERALAVASSFEQNAGSPINMKPHKAGVDPAPVAGPSNSTLQNSIKAVQGGKSVVSLPKTANGIGRMALKEKKIQKDGEKSKPQKRKREENSKTENRNKRGRVVKPFSTRDPGERASERDFVKHLANDFSRPLNEKNLQIQQEKNARQILKNEQDKTSKKTRTKHQKPKFYKIYEEFLKTCPSEISIKFVQKKILKCVKEVVQTQVFPEVSSSLLQESFSNLPEESGNETVSTVNTSPPEILSQNNRKEPEEATPASIGPFSNYQSHDTDSSTTDSMSRDCITPISELLSRETRASEEIPGTSSSTQEQIGLSHPPAIPVLPLQSSAPISILSGNSTQTPSLPGSHHDNIPNQFFNNLLFQTMASLYQNPQVSQSSPLSFRFVPPTDLARFMSSLIIRNAEALAGAFNNSRAPQAYFPPQYYYPMNNLMDTHGLAQLLQPHQPPILLSVPTTENASPPTNNQTNISNQCLALVPFDSSAEVTSEHCPEPSSSTASVTALKYQPECCTPVTKIMELPAPSGDSRNSLGVTTEVEENFEVDSLNKTPVGKNMEDNLNISAMDCTYTDPTAAKGQLTATTLLNGGYESENNSGIPMEVDDDLQIIKSLNKITENENIAEKCSVKCHNVEKSSRKRSREEIEERSLPQSKKICINGSQPMEISDGNKESASGHPTTPVSIPLSNAEEGMEVTPQQLHHSLDTENEKGSPHGFTGCGRELSDENIPKSAGPGSSGN